MFNFKFGLTTIVAHPTIRGFSILRDDVAEVIFEYVYVELADGSNRREALVHQTNAYSSVPALIPRTHSRQVLWIQINDLATLLNIQRSRPTFF
jgi:hypothetical protein